MPVIADRLAAVHQVFRDYVPGLPCPKAVLTTGGTGSTADDPERTGIRMQFDNMPDVVAWALRFDAPVMFSDRSMFVNVTTIIDAYGARMLAWVHLTHAEAYHLLQNWGYQLTRAGVSIPAAHADALSRTLVAA